jgi:hypothetical protein
MRTPLFKIGDRLRNLSTDGIVEVHGVMISKTGDVNYWVDDDGDRDPRTITENALENNHRLIEPFFEVGKTYAYDKTYVHGRSIFDRYKIREVREVNGRKYAWVEFCPSGMPDSMVMLTEDNFKHMTEV